MNKNLNDFNYRFTDFVGVYDNFFTKKECKNAIDLFEKYHKKNFTYQRIFNEGLSKNDTSLGLNNLIELDCDVDFIDSFQEKFYSKIYPLYNLKYPTLQILTKHKIKYIKIQKTNPQEGYHVWHCEHDGESSRDRVLSWILYLNTIDDGGETEFLYQSLRVKPKQGTFILFPASFTHTHRGNPPLKESKYVATGWVEFLNTPEKQGMPNINLKLNMLKEKKNEYEFNYY